MNRARKKKLFIGGGGGSEEKTDGRESDFQKESLLACFLLSAAQAFNLLWEKIRTGTTRSCRKQGSNHR